MTDYSKFTSFEDFEHAVPNGANTRGWLTLGDSQAFMDAVKRMPDDGTVVVLGIYAGAQLAVAKLIKPNATVIGIDPFTNETEWKANGRHLRDVCHENLERAGVLRNVTIIEDFSQNVGKTWNVAADIVLVDGDHRTSMALQDLQLFAPHVRIGGVLAIDDMNPTSDVRIAYAHWWQEERTIREWKVIRETHDDNSDKMWVLRRTS